MRYLSELLGNEITSSHLAESVQELHVTGLTSDSREVKPGFVFVAISGVKQDGKAYVVEAAAHGAVAIVTDVMPSDATTLKVPVLIAVNPRHALAMMAARFYDQQPKWVVAVTGTDGKTSSAHFYQQIWRMLGEASASIGTLGVIAPAGVPEYPALNTTPGSVLLHKILAELARHGVQHVAMEASSHGLHQHRLDGVHVRVAGFTNLTRDHLDYHHTEEAYFRAKLRLFTEVLQAGGVAVLNADDARYNEICKVVRQRGCHVRSYGKNGEDYQLVAHEPHAHGQYITVRSHGKDVRINLPLIGQFQAMNILCAAGMVVASGASWDEICAVLPKLEGVPGRMQLAATRTNGAPVFVDYAHTPAGLKSVLKHIRPHVKGKLHVVFGCGGDRDRGKRPEMGKIASELADRVYVTDDNPRTENPLLIRKDVLAKCSGALEIEDREKAIAQAVEALAAGDALIIAGKGHEKIQIIGSKTYPFDDAEVAKQAVMALK